jgi:hypothetical protein
MKWEKEVGKFPILYEAQGSSEEPVDPFVSKKNPVHILTSSFIKTYLNIITQPTARLDLSN